MCPRTSWSLSSFTRNIVLGRASMTSPSISILSSLAKAASKLPARPAQTAGGQRARGQRAGGPARRLAPLEGCLARPLLQEAVDGVLEVLGRKQRGGDVAYPRVGAADAVLEERAHHLLGRGVSARRAGREPAGEAERAVGQLGVGQPPVDHVPALERGGVVEIAGHDELARTRGPGALRDA